MANSKNDIAKANARVRQDGELEVKKLDGKLKLTDGVIVNKLVEKGYIVIGIKEIEKGVMQYTMDIDGDGIPDVEVTEADISKAKNQTALPKVSDEKLKKQEEDAAAAEKAAEKIAGKAKGKAKGKK